MIDFLFRLPFWALALVLNAWLMGFAIVSLWALRRWVLPRLRINANAALFFGAAVMQSAMVLNGLVAALTAVSVWTNTAGVGHRTPPLTPDVKPHMRTFRIRKLVNAFVPNAVPSELVFGSALWAVMRYGKKHGGLWVGGIVELTHEGVSFKPNRVNDAVHRGLSSVVIPIPSIRSVRREFGWLTGVVVIEHENGEFRFRCFGAKEVASRFRSYLDET